VRPTARAPYPSGGARRGQARAPVSSSSAALSKELHRQCCQPACCKAAPFALQEVHTCALWQGEAAAVCAEAQPEWLQYRSGSVFSSVRPCECFTDIPVAPAPACVSAVHARAQSASRRRRIARGSGHREMDVTGMLGTFTQMRARMNSLSQMLKAGGAHGARLRSPAVSSAPIAASASSAATDNVIFQHGVCMHTSAFKCPCCTSLLPAECACRCRACHPCPHCAPMRRTGRSGRAGRL